MADKTQDSTSDPRYLALRRGLEQLTRRQLMVLAEHVECDNPIVVDGCNYNPANHTWCPLAVALGVGGILRDEGIVVRTDEEAKDHIVRIGARTNPGFTLNPMRGIVGSFFTSSRSGDLMQACRDVLREETFYRDGPAAPQAGAGSSP